MYLTFITFTLPHVATDSLDELLEAVDKAWRNVISGGGWQNGIKTDFGVIGQIKAVEATVGRHGWHPHLHVLFFHNCPTAGDDGTLEAFRDALGARWGHGLNASSVGPSTTTTASTPSPSEMTKASATTSPRSTSNWPATT